MKKHRKRVTIPKTDRGVMKCRIWEIHNILKWK